MVDYGLYIYMATCWTYTAEWDTLINAWVNMWQASKVLEVRSIQPNAFSTTRVKVVTVHRDDIAVHRGGTTVRLSQFAPPQGET